MLLWIQTQMVEGVPQKPPIPPISTANTLVLYRFAGTATKQGPWAGVPSLRGGPLTFPVDSPFGNQSAFFTNNAGLSAEAVAAPFSGTGPLTIGGWFKTSNTANQVIVQQRGGANNGQFQIYTINGNFNYYDGTNSTIRVTTAPGVIVPNEWMHFVVVRLGVTTKIYLNGVEAASTTNTSAANILTTNAFAIGFDLRDTNKFFQGNLRDVFIANRAFTLQEIEYLGKLRLPYPPLS